MFSLPLEFTDKELGQAYRKAALLYHPDRTRSLDPNHQMEAKVAFEFITKAYKLLKEYLRAIEGSYRDHAALKQAYNEADGEVEVGEGEMRRGGVSASDEKMKRAVLSAFSGKEQDFDIEKFNRMYDDTRLKDDGHDTGYGDWLSSHHGEEAGQRGGEGAGGGDGGPNARSGRKKFDAPQFNAKFTAQKGRHLRSKRTSTAIISIDQVHEANRNSGGQTYDLDRKEVLDYSGEITGNGSKLTYADVKQAHDLAVIDVTPEDCVSQAVRKRYDSLQDIERDRENISMERSAHDLARDTQNKLREDTLEHQRLERVFNRDKQIQEQHARINKHLLTQGE